MKDDLLAFSGYFILLLGFAFISAFVFLSRGNKRLTAWKLRLGAMLLSLNLVIFGCKTNGEEENPIMCYDPMPDNYITFDIGLFVDNEIYINLSEDSILSGKISNRISSEFSFSISDTAMVNTFRKENIEASDGKFDSNIEDFDINFDGSLGEGLYYINFYKGKADNLDKNVLLSRNYLRIVK